MSIALIVKPSSDTLSKQNYNRLNNGTMTMSRTQLNVRVSEELERAIDEKRIELRAKLGAIPTRSDVLRLALEAYLGIALDVAEVDRRSTTGPEKRRVKKSGA